MNFVNVSFHASVSFDLNYKNIKKKSSPISLLNYLLMLSAQIEDMKQSFDCNFISNFSRKCRINFIATLMLTLFVNWPQNLHALMHGELWGWCALLFVNFYVLQKFLNYHSVKEEFSFIIMKKTVWADN